MDGLRLPASLFAALVLTSVISVAGEKGNHPASPRVLYKLKPGASPAELGALNAVVRARGLAKVKRLKGLGIEVARAAQGSDKDVCADLVASGAVLYAEPDALVPPVAVPNDPSYGSQWHHAKINSAGAWDTTTGSQTILAAVCDTGVESGHIDLAPNLQLPGYNSVDGTTNSEPIHSHGTYVAGCIGAVGNNGIGVAGMSWQVKILPIRISNRADGNAYISDAAEAIRYAADQGAKVANLSYRMASYAAISDAGQYIRDRGGLLFVAAGNDGIDPDWPDYPSFIAVGATDQNDNRSGFSSYGAYVDCVAPGSSIRTTAPGGGTGSVSGTSFASPITAGLATLLYAADSSLTAAEVENIILGTCVDLGDPGDDNVFGHGRINAAAALAAVGTGNTAPNAVVSASPTSGVAPLAVHFDGAASTDPDGALVAYAWSFGDGAAATTAVADHTYADAGTYTATLTVTDNLGATDTASIVITVTPDPDKVVCVLSIAMSAVDVPSGTVAQATVTVVDGNGAFMPNATVYADWTGTKASQSIGTTDAAGKALLESLKNKKTWTQTVTITNVVVAGYTYDASLNLETSDTISSDAAANQPPVAAASADTTVGAPPLTVNFDGSGSSDPDGAIASYAWDFGDGSAAAGATAQYTYHSPGTYVATLTVTDDQGATDTDSVTITVVDGTVILIHVAGIDLATVTVPGGIAAEARVRIADEAGAPFPGATVTGTWSGVVSGTSTGVTNAAGEVVLASRKTKKTGTITFTVTDVTAPNAIYDPGSNTETAKTLAVN